MKKLLPLLLGILMFLPLSTQAAIATPWSATSTEIGVISPNLINGNLFAISVKSLFMSVIANLEGTISANDMAGGDIGAQINAAYAILPATGGIITVRPGTYTQSTEIQVNTSGKLATIVGAGPGTVINSTVVATSSVWNAQPSSGHSANWGFKNLVYNGPATAINDASVAIEVGGNIGGQGWTGDGLRLNKWGRQVYYGANTYQTLLENSFFSNGTYEFYAAGATNSGENLRFINDSFTDSYGANTSFTTAQADQCVTFNTNGAASAIMSGVSFDDCGLVNNDGNLNLTLIEPHFENPGVSNGTTNQYTYIKNFGTNNFNRMNLQGGTIMNDASSTQYTPNQYILNSGLLSIDGTTFNGNNIGVAAAAVNNFGTNGKLIVQTSSKLGNSAYTTMATSSVTWNVDVQANLFTLALNENQTGNYNVNGLVFVGSGSSANAVPFDVTSTADPATGTSTATNYPVFITNPNNTNASSTGIGFSVTSGTSVGASIIFQRQGSNSFGDLLFATEPSGGNATERLRITSAGNVGIGTSSPGTILSIQGVGNFHTATSTFSSTGGLNLTAGCYAIRGTCVGGSGGSGTVTNVATDATLTGGPITTTGTLGIDLTHPNTWTGLQQFNGNASTTQLTVTGSSYFTGATATSTISNAMVINNYFRTGIAPNNNYCITASQNGIPCAEVWGNDNTANGVQFGVGNTNAGGNAYSFMFMNNNLSSDGLSDFYSGLGFTGGDYTSTTFGTALNQPSQFQVIDSAGPVTIGSSATTTADGYVNVLVHSTGLNTFNTGDEVVRFTTASSTFRNQISSLSNLTATPHYFFGDGSDANDWLLTSAGGRGSIWYTTSDALSNEAFTVAAGSGKGVDLDVNCTNNVFKTSCTQAVSVASNGATTITSASTTALSVGPSGYSTPAFLVDGSVTSTGTGVGITGEPAGTTGGPIIQAVSSTTNEDLTAQSKGTGVLQLNGGNGGAGSVKLQTNSATRVTVTGNAFTFTPGNANAAATVRYSFVDAADATLTAGAEAPEVYYNLANSVRNHGSNTAITLQRDIRITGSTHSFTTSGGTIANVAALSIDGPNSAGTNATFSTSSALYIPTSAISTTATGTDINVSAPTGATDNFSIYSNGRIVLQSLKAFATGDSAVCIRSGGEVTFDSGVSSCIVSSKFVKDPQGNDDYQQAYDRISKLQVALFNYKDSGNADIGLYAEDVAKIDSRYAQYTKIAHDESIGNGQVHHFNVGDPAAINWSAIQADMIVVLQHQALGYKVTRSVEENYQWGFTGLLVLWNLYLTKRKK